MSKFSYSKTINPVHCNPEAVRRVRPPRSDPEYAHLVTLSDIIQQVLAKTFSNKQIPLAVDLGCGSRPYDDMLRKVAEDVVGVDISDNPLADIIYQPGEPVPLPDAQADLVTCFQVFEHVSSPEDFLKECNRLLKPGGTLILSAPGMWPYHPHPSDYRRWTHDGLRLEIERADFVVQSVTPVLRGWSAGLQVLLTLLRYTFWHRRLFRWLVKMISYITSYLIDILERFPGPTANLISSTYVVVAYKERSS